VLEPIVARVDLNVCSGCRTCEAICPFDAIGWDEDEASATIEDTLCRGCGICAAACPSGAITVCHFSREAVCAEIAGLLKPDGD
jgi:heterodisulfide reductase subunit A